MAVAQYIAPKDIATKDTGPEEAPEKDDMAGHICDNCGAAVGNEQFCPTCGAWVDPLQNEGGGGDFEKFSLGERPTDEPPAPTRIPRQEIQCPSCGSPNPATNRHCEECGARLTQGAMPVAPRPAVQTTAGVRAAMGISAVLVVVILAVILVNIFGGDGDPTTVSTDVANGGTTTTTARPEAVPLTVLAPVCDPEGLSGFGCDKLVDGVTDRNGEYQFNWIQLEAGATPTLTLKFAEPVLVRQILWTNIDDPDRFAQNLKVQRIAISDDNDIPLPTRLENEPGVQVISYISLPTTELTIEITEAYSAVATGDNVFEELAIAEIQVLGNPAGGGTTGATTGGTTGSTTGSTTSDTTAGG